MQSPYLQTQVKFLSTLQIFVCVTWTDNSVELKYLLLSAAEHVYWYSAFSFMLCSVAFVVYNWQLNCSSHLCKMFAWHKHSVCKVKWNLLYYHGLQGEILLCHCITTNIMYHKTPKCLDTHKICCNQLNIWTKWLYHRVMCPKDADSDNGKQCRPWSDCSLIWIYTVCPALSVRKLRIIKVFLFHPIKQTSEIIATKLLVRGKIQILTATNRRFSVL